MANLELTRWPCNVCGWNLGYYMGQVRATLRTPKRKSHHPMSVAFICYGCMQEPIDERHKRWWQEVFHNHVVLADPIIQDSISQYLWSSFPYHPCFCGNCDPSWLSRGWICKEYSENGSYGVPYERWHCAEVYNRWASFCDKSWGKPGKQVKAFRHIACPTLSR